MYLSWYENGHIRPLSFLAPHYPIHPVVRPYDVILAKTDFVRSKSVPLPPPRFKMHLSAILGHGTVRFHMIQSVTLDPARSRRLEGVHIYTFWCLNKICLKYKKEAAYGVEVYLYIHHTQSYSASTVNGMPNAVVVPLQWWKSQGYCVYWSRLWNLRSVQASG